MFYGKLSEENETYKEDDNPYSWGRSSWDRDNYKFFINNLEYTKIDINAPSKVFTDDLWIKDKAPLKTYFLNFIIEHQTIVYTLMTLFVSFLAGAFAGIFIFREFRNLRGAFKFGFLGMFNIFTIIGLWIVMKFAKTSKRTEEVNLIIEKIKQKKYYKKRKIIAFLYYVILPFFILAVLSSPYWVTRLISGFEYGFNRGDYFVPIVFLLFVVFWKLLKINKEDACLFDELKSNNYSTRTFQFNDERKIHFLILFSVSFLFSSSFIFKVVEKLLSVQIIFP